MPKSGPLRLPWGTPFLIVDTFFSQAPLGIKTVNGEKTMKTLGAGAALLAAATLAWAVQGKPINDSCPVKGTAIKPGITSSYKGKTVGFC